MNFGDNVRMLREQHNYSQTEVSSMIGISQPTYAQYETQGKVPNMYTAIKIAKLFGVTVEELAFGKENSK